MSDGESKPDVQARIAALEEELRDAKTVLLQITNRDRDVQGLAVATERLTESTTGLESTLTTVGRAMEAAKDAKRSATEAKRSATEASLKADDSIVQLAQSEHRYRRHTRRYASLAVIVALLASGGVLLLQRHTADQFHQFAGMIEKRCEQRQHQYDEPNHLSVGADVTELKSQLRQASADHAATETLIRTFPPAQRAHLRADVREAHKALRNDLAVKEAAFAAGVPGSCQNLTLH